MGGLCVYAIKSALCLAVMYVPYMLMLRNETFYRFNRFVLVSIVTLSFVLPALNIAPLAFLDQTEVAVANRALAEVGIPMVEIGVPTYELAEGVKEEVREISFGWADIIVAIYIIGVVAVLSVKAVQLVRMLLFMRRGCLWVDEDDGVKVYCHARQVVPFSWMRNIVVSEHDYNESGRAILLHEKAHIRCGHSADVCLVALCEVMQWFNPFVWLLSSSLSDVHEYEADAEVLKNDIDARSYQMLLIKKAVGSSSYTFANSFNHSLLKKRITMMMKKKSSPWMRMKALYVIPMAAFALSAFATSEFNESAELISEGKVSNLTANDQMQADDKKGGKPVFVVDGKVVEIKGLVENDSLTNDRLAELLGVKPADIAHLTVLKEESAVEVYGEKGKYGAILIETKAYVEAKGKAVEKSDEDEVFMIVEQMPQFPGGHGELAKFIAMNIRYPELARENGVSGRLIVQFVVEKDGTTSEHKIMKWTEVNKPRVQESADQDGIVAAAYSSKEAKEASAVSKKTVETAEKALEDEAIRVISSMPKWMPGMQKGKAVRVRYTIPITYRLQ